MNNIFTRDRAHFDTEDEVAFLERLGTWIPPTANATKCPRPYLLEQYKEAAQKRHNWGTIDPAVVHETLNQLLESQRAS